MKSWIALSLFFFFLVANGQVQDNVVLWSQTTNAVMDGILCQQFNDLPNNPRFQTADDFNVPSNTTFQIVNVTISGFYTDSPVTGSNRWNVQIWGSASTNYGPNAPSDKPPIFEEYGLDPVEDQAATNPGSFGEIVIALSNPPILEPGNYWLSVFPTLSGPHFFWQLTSNANLEPMFIKQFVGINICPNETVASEKWAPYTLCPPALSLNNPGQTNIGSTPDVVFTLIGNTGVEAPPSSNTTVIVGPTTGTVIVGGTTAQVIIAAQSPASTLRPFSF